MRHITSLRMYWFSRQNLSCPSMKLIKHTPENTMWVKNRKYKMGKIRKYKMCPKVRCMRRQLLNILAGHMMHHHMVAAAGGGRHHVVRGGRITPHIMWPASIFSICLRMYFLFLPHIVFAAFVP